MILQKAFAISPLCVAVSSATSIRGGKQHRDLATRIIGGDAVTEGRYYAVSLQDSFGHFCGGSLIAPDMVLTAAHCQQHGAGYKAVIGRHNLDGSDGEEAIVKTEIAHRGFDWGTTDNDYMILVLDRPVKGEVVRVSPDVIRAGTPVTVMGWGDTHPADDIMTYTEELMETEVFVVSNNECDQSKGVLGGKNVGGWMIGGYEETYENQITENMMCAEDHGEDSCQGDSGGPLVIRSGSGDVQVGIVSWGVSCAHTNFPGVYSRISSQYEWIRTNVCRSSSTPPASFECGGNHGAVVAQQRTNEGTQALPSIAESWTPIAEEDFTDGVGIFDKRRNAAKRYTIVKNRRGVVRIAGGESSTSAIVSNQIDLNNSSFSRLRVGFSFYATEMVHSSDVCISYTLDNGSVAGEKCWSSLHAFELGRWYDGESIEFASAGAKSLGVRIRVDGGSDNGNVLIDSVTIQGME